MDNNTTIISTKQAITSHLNSLYIKKTKTCEVGNPDPDLEQAHTCGSIKPLHGMPTLPSSYWNLQQQCKEILLSEEGIKSEKNV